MKLGIFNKGKGKLSLFLLMLTICFNFKAQIVSIQENRPENMTVCMGNYPFSVILKNTSQSNISSITILLDLPDYISYTGNLTNAILQDSSNLNQPIFRVSELEANDSIIIFYTASANCDIIPSILANSTIQNSYYLEFYTNGVLYQQAPILQSSYNLLYADLSISVSNSITNNLTIGQRANYYTTSLGNRIININNGGNGVIDTVVIRITKENELLFNDFMAFTSHSSIANVTEFSNEYIIKIAGSELVNCGANSGTNPNLFEPGESIQIIEDFEIITCSPNNFTSYAVQWGCQNKICSDNIGFGNTYATSNINVNQGNAQFSILSGEKDAFLNYCHKDGEMIFYFVNNSMAQNDFAKDLKIDILSYENNNGINVLPFSFGLFDYSVNNELISSNLITGQNIVQTFYPNIGNSPGYTIDFSNNLNPLILDDLDGDNYYDDLQAGDTLILKIKVRYLTSFEFENECPVEFLHNYGLPQISWKTTCNEVLNSQTLVTYYDNRYLNYSYYFEQLTDKIEVSSDFSEGVPENFTFCTGNWYYNQNSFECPVDEYKAVINLPLGYHLSHLQDSATWVSMHGDSVSLFASESNNQIIIYGGGKSIMPNQSKAWTGCYTVQLELVCPQNNDFQSISNISWEMLYKCDTCEIYQRKACSSEGVYNHFNSCSSNSSCSGIISKDFNLERISLGWTDETQTVHASPNNGINLKAAYPFDKVQSKTSGVIVDNIFNSVFVELSYNSLDTLFSFLDGKFEIYNNQGNLITICNANLPILNVNAGTYTYTFQFSCNNSFNIGDSIVLVSNWLVLNSILINPESNINVDIYPIPDLRSRFIVDYNGTLTSCDSWGENFKLYSVETFPRPILLSTPNGCNEITLGMYWQNLGGTLYNDFPNEFRNLCELDNIVKFIIPEGYEYIDSSSQANGYICEEQNLSDHYNQNFQTLINPILSLNKDTLIFNYNWKLQDKYGSNAFPTNNFPIFTFKLRPISDHQDTVFTIMDYTFKKYAYSETQYHELVNWKQSYTFTSDVDTSNLRWYHYVPNLSLEIAQPLVEGFENEIEWELKLCNKIDENHSIISDAEGIWLNINNISNNDGDIHIIDILNSSNTTIYDSSESSFVEIHSLNAGECIDLTVKAKFTSCFSDDIDSLRIISGWNCFGYPNPELANQFPCKKDTNYLLLRYKTANLQLEATHLPNQDVPFQVNDVLHYEFNLTSSSPANMYNVDFWLNLPEGLSLVNAMYSYPNNNNWLSINSNNFNYLGNNVIGWNIDSLAFQAQDYVFIGSRNLNLNKIWISFDLQIDCSFNPANVLSINASGKTNCHDSIFLNSQYFINYLIPTNNTNYELYFSPVDSLNCNHNTTMSINIKNIGNVMSQIDDSLRLSIPAGFNYVPEPSLFSQVRITTNQLIWSLSNLDIDSLRTFYFTFTNNNFQSPKIISIVGEIVNPIEYNCNSLYISDTLNTTFYCNSCGLNAVFYTDTVCLKDEMCFKITDSNMLKNQYLHFWDFGDGSTSKNKEPCHKYNTPGTYTIIHTISDSSTCIKTFTFNNVVQKCDDLVIFPNPTKNFLTNIYTHSVKSGEDTIEDTIKVEIFNTWGDLVKSSFLTSYEDKFNLDFSNYANGVYYLLIYSKDLLIGKEKVLVLE